MFTLTSRIAALAVLAVLLWLPGVADANRGHGHDFVSSELYRIVHHAQDLGLSEEQITKFRSLITDYQKAKLQGQANVKLAEVDVQSLMRDDKADMAAIENAIRKSEAAQSTVRIEGAKAIRGARGILTPEQLQKWRVNRHTWHTEGKQGEKDRTPQGEQAPKT
jgi:Spy/CpxP family protein refolding chaperone